MTIPTSIMPNCMSDNESAFKAYYYLNQFRLNKIIIVTDNENRAVGIITLGTFSKLKLNLRGYDSYSGFDGKTLSEICDRQYLSIDAFEKDIYSAAAGIMASYGVRSIPIIDDSGIPVGIISEWQVFFRDWLLQKKFKAPDHRPHYAYLIWDSARIAKEKGYSEMSVIEFGVAAGTGLILAEKYAVEVERLTGIRIQVYGFDMETGLPELFENDLVYYFQQGDYPMDMAKLKNQLTTAKLILGDIKDTGVSFFQKFCPPPIGTMFIDVDTYTATKSIFEMLSESDDYFLPNVNMYFDDIAPEFMFEGEQLAIDEFNAININMKIVQHNYSEVDKKICVTPSLRLKRLMRYKHPKYVEKRDYNRVLNLNV